jgi:ADP-heptose:LPS heptosyltransferase
MNSNKLIFLDSIIGIILIPCSIAIKITRRIINKFIKKQFKNKLLIKFMGAGNFIVLADILNRELIDIITTSENNNVLNYIGHKGKRYFIDHGNIFKLFTTTVICLFKLSLNNYYQVINLESESKFAKFIATFVSSKYLVGLTNTYKSISDALIYDYYMASPQLVYKDEVLLQLINYSPTINLLSNSLVCMQQNIFFEKNLTNKEIKNITITPSCSNTDNLRRLSKEVWLEVINLTIRRYGMVNINVLFQNSKDEQYSIFNEFQYLYHNINIVSSSYTDLIAEINKADLIITVDSQALHLAQIMNKKTIAFYGPTSPFGINIGVNTLPISRSLTCSPCTHKYLKLPCNNNAYCMNFNLNELSIITRI